MPTSNTPGTAVDSVIARGRIALREADATLIKVAEALVPEPVTTEIDLGFGPSPLPFPPLPTPMNLSVEQKQALADVEGVFGSVNLDRRRMWSEAEIRAAIREYQVINTVAEMAEKRCAAIKVQARTHLDVQAEESGVAVPKALVRSGKTVVPATPRAPSGHYLLEGRISVPDQEMSFVRDTKKGSTTISTDRLSELVEAGEVSRAQYLSITKPVRVLDEEKALAAAKRDESILGLLARITTRSGANIALAFRKNRIS